MNDVIRMSSCPKGYYWDGTRCSKSIRIKKEGIYGKGFLSEPRKEQEAKIRKEIKKEGPIEVERQMAALNAFQHGTGSAHKDLEYAKKEAHSRVAFQDPRCPDGYEYVQGHVEKTGKYVKPFCRKRGNVGRKRIRR